MWHLFKTKFYSVIKENKIALFTEKWLQMDIIILNELSQAQKVKYNAYSLSCGSCIYV